MADNALVLFSLRECPHCEAARAFLRARGVPFVERDVRDELGAINDLAKITGESIVPTLVYGDDVQVGWDAVRVSEMLDDPLPPEEDDDLLAVLEAATEPDADWPTPTDGEEFEPVQTSAGTPVESAEVREGRARHAPRRTSPVE
jgi:glutaredoxin